MDAARPFVDELLVVDTGSMDQTAQIAHEHGARVEHFTWCDDFAAAARNACLDLATGDWILSLDADERLDSESAVKLRGQCYLPPDRHVRTVTNIHDTGVLRAGVFGLPGGPIEIFEYQPRFFPRVPDLRWSGRVHEVPILVSDPASTRHTYSDVPVFHHGYMDVPLYERKQRRNRRLLEMRLTEDPDDYSAIQCLAR